MTQTYYVFLVYEEGAQYQLSIFAYDAQSGLDFDAAFLDACLDLLERYPVEDTPLHGTTFATCFGGCCERFEEGHDDDILAGYGLRRATQMAALPGPVLEWYDAPLPRDERG
jgi:hypothetical protein